MGKDAAQTNVSNTPRHAAGGLGALASTVKHVAAQAGKLQIARTLLRVNQPDGFDCPGCAWPEPKDTSAFEFCENGAKAVAWESTKKKVGPDFFAEHTVSFLHGQDDHWLESQGRLTHPMRYDAATDRYLEVSWDDAFALIADRLKALASPDEAVFYTSGRTSNEAAFLYQLMGRKFGTNNFPDCSNLCHESSGVALSQSIGIGKGTVTLEDFESADAIFVIGQNPGTNHPRMLTELQKAAQRGAKIVSVNPLKERGLVAFTHPQHKLATLTGNATPIASHFVQPVIGGDLALFKGLCKLVLEAEEANADGAGSVLDRAFIDEHTTGFEAFAEDLRRESWERIESESGVSLAQLREIADVFLNADRVIACWAMGLTQQRHGVATIQMVVNLLLMRGQIGKPGAGACPVRGHSNVQGDRTMGIVEKPPPFSDKLGEVFGFNPPQNHGFDVVHAIAAMRDGRAKVFVGMGGNFAAATPDSGLTYAALRNCGLTVHVSTKLNRSHTVVGRDALILPCLGRAERDETAAGPQKITVEDSMSVVHASAGRNAPASEHLLSEPAIVCRLARALFGSGDETPWEEFARDYRLIRDGIADVVPGFADFNARVEEPGGFYLGNAARDRVWNNAERRAAFVVSPIPDQTLPAGQLRLMTLRSHDQYNTTVYGLNDRYRDIADDRMVVFAHADDLRERGLADGDRVDISSHYENEPTRRVENFRVVAYDIPRGCAAGYFPELNPLVSLSAVAYGSNTPVSKLIPVTLHAAGKEES